VDTPKVCLKSLGIFGTDFFLTECHSYHRANSVETEGTCTVEKYVVSFFFDSVLDHADGCELCS